ncbi:LPXTG cell wall anchor domain-containing protein [Asanoa sp. NPDC050611]|uniref:LPXTG cell wall anchor domain-containing protein n=1 Tax=Asanoa sp. NPDC050611 TaxID=3157098 RepID=UPI0033FC7FBA
MPFRGVAIALASLVVVLGAPAPASAHPFGDPQTVAITADPARPDVVRVSWKVGGLDDLTVLGVNLGLLPEDRVLLDGAVFYEPADAAAIGPSQEFAAYLLKQVTVTSDGESCTGVVTPPDDLAKAGADIDYTCPGAVGVASVAVRTLTDLNPAYRTLATGPGGAHAVYTSDAYTHDWSLTGDGVRKSAAAAQIAAVLGGLLLLAAAALVLVRRRKRRA